jgi:hypothetical protein
LVMSIKNAIVTTTINPPTEALICHSKRTDWELIVIGDEKTPHDAYKDIDCLYLPPSRQEELFPELSLALGWSSTTRRNIGLLFAWKQGYEIISTVDDDNIPLANWGELLLVGQTKAIKTYETKLPVFDPLFALGFQNLWHRGFPWQWLDRRESDMTVIKERTILVQADLWNGDPDVDAICRMIQKPNVEFPDFEPFAANALLPFNSQNTFLHRNVIPRYMMLTHTGRVQDIWGSYLLQHFYPDCVVYAPPTVRQDRNIHDLTKDLEDELIQYRDTRELIENLSDWKEILPAQSVIDYELYHRLFKQ